MQPRGLQQGWQLVSSATAKFVQAPAGTDNDVEFGVFLGAGSYGRCAAGLPIHGAPGWCWAP